MHDSGVGPLLPLSGEDPWHPRVDQAWQGGAGAHPGWPSELDSDADASEEGVPSE